MEQETPLDNAFGVFDQDMAALKEAADAVPSANRRRALNAAMDKVFEAGAALKRQAQYAVLNRTANSATAEHDDLSGYKDRVAAVALDYAIRYGWCDEVKQALRDLGISLVDPGFEAEVVVRYKLRGLIGFNHIKSVTENTAEFVLEHLHVPAIRLEGRPGVIEIPEGVSEPSEVKLDQFRLKQAQVARSPEPEEMDQAPDPADLAAKHLSLTHGEVFSYQHASWLDEMHRRLHSGPDGWHLHNHDEELIDAFLAIAKPVEGEQQ